MGFDIIEELNIIYDVKEIHLGYCIYRHEGKHTEQAIIN